MAKIGDIVLLRDYQWTVAEFMPDAQGGRNVKLIANSREHGVPIPGQKSFVRSESFLPVVSSPTFVPGEKVMVGDRWGEVLIDDGADTVPVMLEADEKWVDKDAGIKLTLDAAPADVPRWQLVLENRI